MNIGKYKIKLIIFDMDGLMFDTEKLLFRTWKEACKKYKKKVSNKIFKETIGLNMKKTKEVYKKYFGHSFPFEKIIDESTRLLENHMNTEGVPLKEGLSELLEYIRKKQLKVALATSTERKRTEMLLNISGTKKYFNVVTCDDEIVKGKPDSEIFLKTSQKTGCPPENCMVLEDSKNGIMAAYRAGMLPVMVPDIIKPGKEIEAMLFKKFNSLKEVKDYFEDNFK